MHNSCSDDPKTMYVEALENQILKLKRSNRMLSIALAIAVFFDVIALLIH